MYQARRVPFCNKENYIDKRASRAQEKVKNRRFSRQKNYASNRNIAEESVQTVSHEAKEPERLSRYEQLLRWKQEKECFKKAEQEKKAKEKPPFRCGLVHHKPPPILETECRRSTRIQSMKNPLKEVKISISKSLNITRRRRNDQPPSSNKTFQSFAPASHQFTAPDNLPKIEEVYMSVSEPAYPKEQDTVFSLSFPAQLSPWISKARGSFGEKISPSCKGKNETPLSSRKTRSPMQKLESSKATPDSLRKLVGKRLIQKSLNTPEELKREEKKFLSSSITPVLSKEDADSLQNFRSLYEGEMDRLGRLCSQWDSLLSSETCQEIPVEVQDSIHATVGQTRLLMREKLAQFNGLLHEFKPKSSKSFQVITSSDLQGFWDLVSIQVNDVDTKFTSLDALKWNNWVLAEEPKKNRGRATVRKRGLKNLKTKNPTAKSDFKAYIAEQRKNIIDAKANEAIIGCEGVNSDFVKEEKTSGIMTSPQLIISTAQTPTTILKRRSSRRLSCRRGIDQQGDSITPKRSSRRVTFADTTLGDSAVKPKVRSSLTPHAKRYKGTSVFDERSNLRSVKSPNFSAADGDLISWESPTKDYLHVGRRQSPRFSINSSNSFI